MKQLSKQDLEKLTRHKQVLVACFCAEQVMHLVKERDKAVCMRTIQITYLFLEGKATKEECVAAANAATYAAAAAANAAAYATAYAAYATADAASAAADAVTAAANATNAAANATYAAANAAVTAASASAAASAASASRTSIIKAQWDYYDQLLNSDKYFEDIILSN